MTLETAGFVLNIVILALLAATIYYAWVLSSKLDAFRKNRKEMETLLDRLASHVAQAEGAIQGLRDAADESGETLQILIKRGKGLSEELQLINEAGNSLANRLETLSERSSRPEASDDEAFWSEELDDFEELDDPEGLEPPIPRFLGGGRDPGVEDAAPKSRAEKDLLEALKSSGRTGKGTRGAR